MSVTFGSLKFTEFVLIVLKRNAYISQGIVSAPPPPSNPVQVAVDGVDKKVRGLKLVSKLQAINSR